MGFQKRLINNRHVLGLADPDEPLPLAQLNPEQVAKILTSTIALLDALENVNQSLEIKRLASNVEQAIAQAVLDAKPD